MISETLTSSWIFRVLGQAGFPQRPRAVRESFRLATAAALIAMCALLSSCFGGSASVLPFIVGVAPNTIAAGSGAVIATISGTGFTSSIVVVNGQSIIPNSVTGTQIVFVIPAGLTATPGTLTVIVVNTLPTGNVDSNAGTMTVSNGTGGTAAWTITKTHTGNFAQGQTSATFTITATNSGTASTNGTTVTASDTMPTGLTVATATGSGWNCTTTPTSITCTRTDALTADSSYPAITLTVSVASNAPATIMNTVSISGGGAPAATGSDTVTVTGSPVPDMTITKTHAGNFAQGGTGSYTITVKNIGTGATTAAVSFTDTLPTGLTPGSLSGTGWTCNVTMLSCNRSDPLAASGSYPPVTFDVVVSPTASGTVVNTVTVSGGGETNTSNDTATDPTTIVSAGGLNSLLNSDYVLYATGVNDSTDAAAFLLAHAVFNGAGGATSCGLTYNSPAQVLSDVPCTVTYNVSSTGQTGITFLTATPAQTFGLDALISTTVTNPQEFGLVLSGASESVNLSGYAFRRTPSEFTLTDKNGPWLLAGMRGEVNSTPYVMLGSVTFDTSGNGPGANFDSGIPGGVALSTGSTFLNPIGTSGCGTINTQVDTLPSPPFSDFSYLLNGVYCVEDSDTIFFTSTDTRGVKQPVHAGAMFRQMPGLTTPDKLSGNIVGWSSGVSGSGPSATNGTQLFQFNSDGVSSFTSGTMFQNNAGTVTPNISLAGSTYKMDLTINGRLTYSFNGNGKSLYNSNFTGYLYKPNLGLAFAGTSTTPSNNLGFASFGAQTGSPFSDSSFGTSSFTAIGTLTPPVTTKNWSLVGGLDFSGGVSNFPGSVSFMQNGTLTSQSITGSLTITSPTNGWFAGNLNGLPGGAGAVNGYFIAPNTFNFTLSTGPTSSTIITTGIY
jgi:uncharacterized repeat protein (TIGR01451 family)